MLSRLRLCTMLPGRPAGRDGFRPPLEGGGRNNPPPGYLTGNHGHPAPPDAAGT